MNPPSVFEERLTKFAKAMEDIRAEGAILDSKRLYKVDQTLDKVEKDIRGKFLIHFTNIPTDGR